MSSILDQWANNEPTEYGIEQFTCGDCWVLAFYLHRLGGWRIAFTGHSQATWEHVFVQIDADHYLDVEGVHTRAMIKKKWHYAPRLVPVTAFRSFNAYADYIDGFAGDYERPRERARIMAKRLAQKYVL